MITILFIILGLSILLYCFNLVAKTRSVTIFTSCCIFFSIIAFASATYESVSLGGLEYKFYSLVATILAFVSFVFGYKFYNKKNIRFSYAKMSASSFEYRVILLILLSLIMFYFYAQQYGGILQTMSLGNVIRSKNAGVNTLAFLKHFIPMCVSASIYLFAYLYISKKKNSFLMKLFYVFLLISGIILSIMYMFANDGRLMVGYFVLALILVVLKYKIENVGGSIIKFSIIVSFCFFGIWTIITGSEKLLAMQSGKNYDKEDSSFVQTFTNELSFVGLGFETALDNKAYMIENDFLNGLFAWLPTSMKPIVMEDVWDYNTRLINSGGYGQYPCSIVAQSYYDLGYMGLLVIPFLYGLFIKYIEGILSSKNDIFAYSVYILSCLYLGKGIVYFSLYNIMINIFFIITSWIIMSNFQIKCLKILK